MDINLLSAIVGGVIGIVASIGALIAERLWNRAGRLKIFYMIRSSHQKAIDTFGVSDSDSGPAFVVPLVFELQNTTNTTRVMRDVSVLMYKDGKYVDEMLQVGRSGEKNKEQQEYGCENQSYSFVIQANSIHKLYGTYIYAPGADSKKRRDFDEIRLRYFDERNKSREYHIRFIDKPWTQQDMRGDDNWILLENNTRTKQHSDTEPIPDKVPLGPHKIAYLKSLQEPIGRTSTASAIFKGFSATIVAGIAALSYCKINIWVLGLSFVPVLLFLCLDIYYLQLEKRYRYLYEQVRVNAHPVNFSMKLPHKKAARARIMDCLKSPSIWMFYPAIILILATVLALKYTGVI